VSKFITHKIAVTSPNEFDARKLNGKSHKREKMRYCEDCQRCWEIVVGSGSNSKGKLVHYDGIPTIGKEHVVCSQCKVKLDLSLTN
jgi:hypothetical protein